MQDVVILVYISGTCQHFFELAVFILVSASFYSLLPEICKKKKTTKKKKNQFQRIKNGKTECDMILIRPRQAASQLGKDHLGVLYSLSDLDL